MRQTTLWVPGPLPGLNEIIKAKGTVYRVGSGGRRSDAYGKLKKKWGAVVERMASQQGFEVVGTVFDYVFVERDNRRDPSNVSAGAVKVIEDGLQSAGLLENDGRKQVTQIRQYFLTAAIPGVFLLNSLEVGPNDAAVETLTERGYTGADA